MNIRSIGVAAMTAVAAAIAAAPASANLVLRGAENFQGTGLGAMNTILTITSPANSSFETGSVGRVVLNPNDVITGNALTGASQTQTRSLGSLGVTSAATLRVVFNALEPGSTANSITLDQLTLNIFSPTGLLLFTSLPSGPFSFLDTFTGAGNSGFVFALDSTQAAAAQLAAFGSGFASNLVGLAASASNATGGFETFFVANGVTAPVPEPETYALLLAGLGALGFVARRRKSRA